MTPKAALIDGSRVVIPKLLVLPKPAEREEFVLVGEDLLIASAEIAHQFAMFLFHMAMQVRPPQARHIAISIWTVVSQKKYGIFENDISLILYPKVFVRSDEGCLGKFFISPRSIVCKYHIRCFSL